MNTGPWLIRKRGMFYRPQKSGYTGSLYEAGLYPEDQARAEAKIDPESITAHPIAEFRSQAQADLNSAEIVLRLIDAYAVQPVKLREKAT